MKIAFHGAAREVTGSCHLVQAGGAKLLLDCGMIQGGRSRHERNRKPMPFDPGSLDAVLLSHAHIDHSGRLPLLLKQGYRGPIVTTRATADLCRILLADSGRIHEEDAKWKIKRLRKRREDWKWVTPLFTEEEGLAVLEQIQTVEFDQDVDLGAAGRARFVKAGHILGAAIVQLDLEANGESRRLAFSGDLGVHGARLLSPPKHVERPDFLLIESTYGNRSREETRDRTDLLYDVISSTVDRGGKVVIPSFAVGRTQEILARLNDLVESGRLSGVPVYVDSPMAVAATRAFDGHPEAYSSEVRQQLQDGDLPLDFPGLKLTVKVEDSMAINSSREPAVIISASGMCTAGRVKHHLKHNISNPASTILFVGYQARSSLGQVIQSGISPVRIFGDWYPVQARVETIEGFSAHADREELLEWFGALGGTPKRTFVVHGEEHAATAFGSALRERFEARVEVPELGQEFDLA